MPISIKKTTLLTVAITLTSSTLASAAKNHPLEKLFFVMQAGQSSLTHTKGNTYLLTMPKKSISSETLAVTERPYRHAFSIKSQDFHEHVLLGPNNFKLDPPNIILSWASNNQLKAEAFELRKFIDHKYTVSYNLKLLASQKPHIGDITGPVTITIDSGPCNIFVQTGCSAAKKQEFHSISENEWKESPINNGYIG